MTLHKDHDLIRPICELNPRGITAEILFHFHLEIVDFKIQ